MTESWVYNYDSSKVFTGGYEVRDGLRVVLDKDWNPTGDLVGEDGSTLSITDMVNVSSWSYDPIDQVNWETEYLASASQSDADAYNAKTPEEKDAISFKQVC